MTSKRYTGRMMRRLLAPTLSLAFLLSLTLVAHAQLGASTEDLEIDLSPAYPAPYSTVVVAVRSNSIDLASSVVTVTANGTVVEKGSGQVQVPVQLGAAGSKMTVVVNASLDGRVYSKTLVIHPASVALVTEPQTSTHPFYAGKPLVSANSTVRLVALPYFVDTSGATIPASSLVYTWKFGDKVLESSSGIGKSVLSASAPVQYRDADITLTVTTPDQSLVAQAETTVSPVSPYARIYRDDPLMGPDFDTALPDRVAMSDTEDTFRAAAYYLKSAPVFSWTVNSVPSAYEASVTVRSNGSGQGTAVLGVNATDNKGDGSAEQSLYVTFGQKSSGGLFSL